jgi:hypothetical protein
VSNKAKNREKATPSNEGCLDIQLKHDRIAERGVLLALLHAPSLFWGWGLLGTKISVNRTPKSGRWGLLLWPRDGHQVDSRLCQRMETLQS